MQLARCFHISNYCMLHCEDQNQDWRDLFDLVSHIGDWLITQYTPEPQSHALLEYHKFWLTPGVLRWRLELSSHSVSLTEPR